jgi:hypothetical protein
MNVLQRQIGDMAIEVGAVAAGDRSKRKKKKHRFWYGIWEFTHYDRFGNVKWNQVVQNELADEGEQLMLDVFLRGAAQAGFDLGMANDTPVDTDTMLTLVGEPVGNGYARQALARNSTDWPVLALDAGDYQAISKLVTFTAVGGSIGPVNIMFLTDALSGTACKFIAWAALSEARTLTDGESVGCKMKIKLQ